MECKIGNKIFTNEGLEDKDYCIYCANTGRTKNNPDKCESCGKVYQNKDYKIEEVPLFYVNPKNKLLIDNWSSDFIIDTINKSTGIKPDNQIVMFSRRLEHELSLITNGIKNEDQIMFACPPRIYEILLVVFSYKILEACNKNNIVTSGNIYSSHFVTVKEINPTSKMLTEEIIIIELSSHQTTDQITLVEALCSARKRVGKKTFVITKLNYGIITKLQTTNSLSIQHINLETDVTSVSDLTTMMLVSC